MEQLLVGLILAAEIIIANRDAAAAVECLAD